MPGFLTAALSVDLALLAITYFRFIRPGVLTAADLGLDRSRLASHVGIGLLVGVGILLISALIQAAMRGLGVQQTQLASLECVREFPLAGFLGVVLAGGVLAPIAEELYFRGFVFRSYLQTRGPLVAYGVTPLLFAGLHLNLPALLPIVALALMFSWVFQRTRTIVPGIVGHPVNNTAAFSSTRPKVQMISSSQAAPPAIRSRHQNRRLLISISLAVIIGLLVAGLARPSLAMPLHPPDVHSSTPHRAAGSSMESAELSLIGPTPLMMPERGRVTPDRWSHPGSVTIEPPDHPPR